MDFHGDLKMSELTQDQINALIASIDINDRQINKETRVEDHRIVMTGRKDTEDARQRKSFAAKTKPPVSNITRERIGNKHRGKVVSEEAKEKISKANKGRMPYNTGGTKPEEEKAKASVSLGKYIYTTPLGIFNSTREMLKAFPELTERKIIIRATRGIEGFSRTLK